MSSNSTKLRLIRNVPGDNFQLSDFTTNWDLLDAAPGTHICTSSTRPGGWTAAQAGRTILETDTFRQLIWTGSAWQEPLIAPGAWTMGIGPSQTIGPNATVNLNFGTITAKRASRVLLTAVYHAQYVPSRAQWIRGFVTVNGQVVSVNGTSGFIQWGDFTLGGAWADCRQATVLGIATVPPGTHTVGLSLNTGGTKGANVTVTTAVMSGVMTSSYGGMVTF